MTHTAPRDLAEATRVLMHPFRLQMMRDLWDSPDGLRFSALAKMSPASEKLVGFHLLVLSKAGLVERAAFDVTVPPRSPGRVEARYAATPLSQEARRELLEELRR